MLNARGFSVGDFCHIKENQGHDGRLVADNYKSYNIVGFLLHVGTTYVLLYDTSLGGHDGVFTYSPLVDEEGELIEINRNIYSEDKFAFIEVSKITELDQIFKLSNTKLKKLYNNVKS
jgi:hypothetical protein